MGLGYSIMGQFGILGKTGLITIGDGDVDKIIYLLEQGNEKNGVHVHGKNNEAKELALRLKEKLPVYISSEFLFGVSYALRNQMNENAKQFGCVYEVPEINHHLMEGLQFPQHNKENLIFVVLNSEFYEKNIQLRLEITKEILKKNAIEFVEYQPKSESPLFQVFETLGFGSYVNFYLAMLNELDPSPIPYVDFFKKDLVRRRES
jgi:glucose/mannose-6-phosphate isomerase